MGPLVALLGGASLLASGVSVYSQIKSAQAQKAALRQSTAIQMEQNKKAALQQIRQARIASASMIQKANYDGSRGSGVAGGTASIWSQAAGNIGFQNMQAQAAKHGSYYSQRAATWGSLASAANTAANMANQGREWANSVAYDGRTGSRPPIMAPNTGYDWDYHTYPR